MSAIPAIRKITARTQPVVAHTWEPTTISTIFGTSLGSALIIATMSTIPTTIIDKFLDVSTGCQLRALDWSLVLDPGGDVSAATGYRS